MVIRSLIIPPGASTAGGTRGTGKYGSSRPLSRRVRRGMRAAGATLSPADFMRVSSCAILLRRRCRRDGGAGEAPITTKGVSMQLHSTRKLILAVALLTAGCIVPPPQQQTFIPPPPVTTPPQPLPPPAPAP